MKPIITKLTLVAVAAAVANPAFAGRGAGGVHSNDSSNLSGYQKRMEQERAAEEAAKAAEQQAPAAGTEMQVEESPESGDDNEEAAPRNWPSGVTPPEPSRPDGFLEIQKQ